METLPSRVAWVPTAWDGCGEEVQEVLFNRQASDDIVEALAKDEAAYFQGLPSSAPPADLRARAVRLLSDAVAGAVGRPASEDTTWFWALQLFDTGCLLLPSAPEARVLACAAAACLSGLKLADSGSALACAAPGGRGGRAAWLAGLATKLGGGRCADVSREAVLREQAALLEGARLRGPTVAVWVQIFLVRFDVATRGVHSQDLGRVQSDALVLAQKILEAAPLSIRCQPRVLAAGTCALALCAAGLVALEALQRTCEDEAAAESLAAAAACVAGAAAGRRGARCAVPQDAAESLKFAVGCDDEQLRRGLRLGLQATAPQQQEARSGASI